MEALGKMKSHVLVSLDESSLRFKCPSKEYSETGFRGGHSKCCLGKAAEASYSLMESTDASWRPDMSALLHFMTASYKMVCCKPGILTHFHTLNFLSVSLLGKRPTYRNWSSLLMFLPWEAFVRKIIIHSTDTCKELCWICRDEGWLLPSENSHAGQREIRSVEEGVSEDGRWSETSTHRSWSLDIITGLEELGWILWMTWHL